MGKKAQIPLGFYVGQRIMTTKKGAKIIMQTFGEVYGGSRTPDCLGVMMDGTSCPQVVHKDFIMPVTSESEDHDR